MTYICIGYKNTVVFMPPDGGKMMHVFEWLCVKIKIK